MMTKVIITVLILIIAMSCNNVKNTSKCQVYNTSIQDEDHSYEYMLSSEDKLYLIGSYQENYKDARTEKIFVKETIRSLEGKWTDIVKVAGKCEVATQTSDYIYIISLEYLTEKYNPEFSKHKLYRISKKSGQIEELYEWKEENLSFKGLYFYSEMEGYIFIYSHHFNLGTIFRTNDGGRKWVELDTKVNTSSPFYLPNSFHFFSKKNQIVSIDKKSNKLDSIQFDLNITDFSVGENGDYWLLGKEENKTVLQSYANGQTTDVHTFSDDINVSPDQLYKYNELIVVIASQIDENMLGGFGGTKPLMFVSKDNGLTWSNHPLDEALYLKPVSFYKDERMTAYIGQGKVLRCNLKK